MLQVARATHTAQPDAVKERVSALYEKHRNGIYGFLVAQGLPLTCAQEVAQDVFVKLFVTLRDGVEVTSEQGWLYGVAAKSAVDYWRREGRSIWVELDGGDFNTEPLSSSEPNPEEAATQTQRIRHVASELLKLPKEQRLCIHLRSQGMRYREIGEILGVSVSTVSEWLSIAVQRLRGVAHD